MNTVFVLEQDGLGSTRSTCHPIGVFVLTEDEAKAWVARCEKKIGDYGREYTKLILATVVDGEVKETP